MKIPLDLSRHCVATEARRLYETAVKDYFKAGEADRPGLEERIEALKDFLETVDMHDLRARNPVLAGGTGEPAALVVDGDGRFLVEAAGEIIIPEPRV